MYVTVDPPCPRVDPPGGSKILQNQFFAYNSSTIQHKSIILGILLENDKSHMYVTVDPPRPWDDLPGGSKI